MGCRWKGGRVRVWVFVVGVWRSGVGNTMGGFWIGFVVLNTVFHTNLVVKHLVPLCRRLLSSGAAVVAGARDILSPPSQSDAGAGAVELQLLGRCPCWGSDWLDVVAIDSADWMCHAESAMTGLSSPPPVCLSSCGGIRLGGRGYLVSISFSPWVFFFPVPGLRLVVFH